MYQVHLNSFHDPSRPHQGYTRLHLLVRGYDVVQPTRVPFSITILHALVANRAAAYMLNASDDLASADPVFIALSEQVMSLVGRD